MTGHPIRRIEDRAERRDEVLYRTRVTLADRRSVSATLVNLSPHGLMVRADVEVPVGQRIEVALPVAGTVAAVVRWSLGGRLGCELDRAIEPRTYHAVLAAASA